MITVDTATELRVLLKRYIDAQAASTRAQDARARLQAGTTRARSTTANANWARAAEHRDRCADAVEARLRELVLPPRPPATTLAQDPIEDMFGNIRFTTTTGKKVRGMKEIYAVFAAGEGIVFPNGVVAWGDPNRPGEFTVGEYDVESS